MLEANIQQYRTSDIYKQIILILSRLSDSEPGKRGSYFQAQAQAQVIVGRYVLLGVINTIFKHCHAWVILWNAAEGSIFGPWTLYLSFGTCHEVNIMQLCSFSIHK